MTSPPWFRFYSEALNDRKILRVCRETAQPKALVIGVWTTVLALASDSPQRGLLLFTEDIPLTFDDLAIETGLDGRSLEELLWVFDKFDMLKVIDDIYTVVNWDKRQFASDYSTDRVREWREKQKRNSESDDDGNDSETLDSNNNETLQKQSGNTPDTEADTDTETEAEEDFGANAPPTPPPKPPDPPKSRDSPLTDGARAFLELFSAKRFSNNAQRDAVLSLEEQYPGDFLACARWAAEKGVARGQAIAMMRSALPDWGKPKNGNRAPPHSRTEPAGFQGIRDWLDNEGIGQEAINDRQT